MLKLIAPFIELFTELSLLHTCYLCNPYSNLVLSSECCYSYFTDDETETH